jgi:hypothetical protein
MGMSVRVWLRAHVLSVGELDCGGHHDDRRRAARPDRDVDDVLERRDVLGVGDWRWRRAVDAIDGDGLIVRRAVER